MADLNVTIGADCTAYNAGLQQAGQTARDFSNDASKSLANAAMSTDQLGGAAQSASMRFMQMRSGVSAARDGVMAFTLGGQAAERSLMAMGHHITSLVNETGSFKGAMGALASSLWGPGGMILGLTLAAELIDRFAQSQSAAYDATKHFSDATDAQNAVFNDIDDSYKTAVSNVSELTENIKLAKEGFLDKDAVVKEYNETLGKTMGAVKTLNEVEAKLVAGAPDYIKMMLYKAAAQTALKEASDKALEAAKVQLKPQDDFKPNALERFALGGGTMAPGAVPGSAPLSASQVENKVNEIANTNRAKEKEKFEKDQNDLLKIFNNFQEQATAIAAKNKWHLLPDDEVGRIEQIRQKIKQLQEDILANPGNKDADLLKITELKKQLAELSPSIKKTKDGFSAIQAEIDKLSKSLQDRELKGEVISQLDPTLVKMQKLNAALYEAKQRYEDLLRGPANYGFPSKGNQNDANTNIDDQVFKKQQLKDQVDQQLNAYASDRANLETLLEEKKISLTKYYQGIYFYEVASLSQKQLLYSEDSQQYATLTLQKTNAAKKLYNELDKLNTTEAKQEESDAKQRVAVMKELENVIGQGLNSAFLQAASGSENLGTAMAHVFEQMAEKIAAAAAEALILYAIIMAIPGAAEFLGVAGSFTSIFSQVMGISKAAASVSGGSGGGVGHTPAYATGGIATRAHIGMIGEAGPEAIIPLNRMHEFTGGGGSNFTVEHRVSGSDLLLVINRATKTQGRKS